MEQVHAEEGPGRLGVGGGGGGDRGRFEVRIFRQGDDRKEGRGGALAASEGRASRAVGRASAEVRSSSVLEARQGEGGLGWKQEQERLKKRQLGVWDLAKGVVRSRGGVRSGAGEWQAVIYMLKKGLQCTYIHFLALPTLKA